MAIDPKNINFEEVWSNFRDILGKLLILDPVSRLEWNERFSDLYLLKNAASGGLIERLLMLTREYLLQHVRNHHETMASSDEKLLVYYNEIWKKYSQGIYYLNKLYERLYKFPFGEMVENYNIDVPRDEKVPIGKKLGLVMWKKYIIGPLKSRLLHRLLEGIRRDRHGVFLGPPVFHGVIESFVQVEEYARDGLEFYREFFETPFLEATGEYYRQEASQLRKENDCSQYMEKALPKLEEEDLRSRKYLHHSSYTKVTRECEKYMVADHLQFLLGEMKKMVSDANEKDLRHLRGLLKSFPSETEILMQELQQHITKTGITAVEGDNNLQTFFESFITFHDKFSSIIKSAFSGDILFIGAFDKACISVINHDWRPKFKCRSPELLAKYCDFLLKKNAKHYSEDQVENKLNNSIIIYTHIDDKDIFQELYARFLAKRLIHKQSMSMDAEESMIKKLKEICYSDYAKKLQCMLSDVKISDDLERSFTEFRKTEKIKLGIRFSISVFQTDAWPFKESVISEFSIPQELEKSMTKFESFYTSKYKGRKLTWLHHMCKAELKLCYLEKPYVVSMSTYQMAILLLFERTDVLTYKEIAENTKLSDETLQNQIKSVLKSKLILATESEESFEAESSFSLNKKYTNRRKKFEIAPAEQQVVKIDAPVSSERKAFLEAAIVRIMKARKVLGHKILIEEVINQSKNRFVPEVPMIKKYIDSLIDREYIERTPDSRDEYSYVSGSIN